MKKTNQNTKDENKKTHANKVNGTSNSRESKTTLKDILKITGLPVLFASMCCLAPAVLVLFGLSSVAFAASLADSFYGDYKWVFRSIGLILLTISLIIYFRKKGICTLDQAKRQKNKIINTTIIALLVAIFAYIIWLYVFVELLGVQLGIWDNHLAKVINDVIN